MFTIATPPRVTDEREQRVHGHISDHDTLTLSSFLILGGYKQLAQEQEQNALFYLLL